MTRIAQVVEGCWTDTTNDAAGRVEVWQTRSGVGWEPQWHPPEDAHDRGRPGRRV